MIKQLRLLLLVILPSLLTACAGSYDQTGWNYHRVYLSYKINATNPGLNPSQIATEDTLSRSSELPQRPTGRMDIASLVKGFEASELEGMQIRLHVVEKNSGQMKTYTLTREQVLAHDHLILEDVPVGDVTLRLELRTPNNEVLEFDQKGLKVESGQLSPVELVIERKRGGGSSLGGSKNNDVGLPVVNTPDGAGTRSSVGDFGVKLNPLLAESADNYLTIKWTGTSVAGIKGYRLLQDGKVISELHPFSVFTYSGLTPSTHYKLGVQAVFASGLTAWEPVEADTLTPGARSGGGGDGGGGVPAPGDPPPVIQTWKADPHPVIGVSNVTELTCEATDNLPLQDSWYTWSCDGGCGTFNKTSGKKVIWRAPATAGGSYTMRVTVTDNVNPPVSKTFPVTVVAGSSTTTAITPGALKWSYDMGNGSIGPSLDTDGTIYISANDKLFAFTPEGAVKWQITAPATISGTPAITANGQLVLAGGNGRVYSFDKNNGNIVWTYDGTASSTSFDQVGVAEDPVDGTLYVASQSGKMHAINPNGTEKWVYTISGGGISYQVPIVGPDRTIYVSKAWPSGDLHAVNPDGTTKWTYSIGGTVLYTNVAIAADGTLYMGDTNFKLYALNPNGTLKWTNNAVAWQFYATPAIGPDGTIYFGGEDGKIYAVNPVDGSVKWTYDTGNWAEAGVAVGSDGIIYTGSYSNKFYALYPDGTLQWEYITDNAVRSTPAISKSGVIYFSSFDNKLYAIYASSNGLAKSSFPISRPLYGMEKAP